MSQAANCRQQGLKANSFSGRLSEFRAQGISELPELIPVQLKTDEQPSLPADLVFTAQGCRLELPPPVSAQWLAQLLRCLS